MVKKFGSNRPSGSSEGRIPRSSCIRCGTCCLKGGPVLHYEDVKILLDGYAGHQHLMTLRKGELAMNPVTGGIESLKKEIVKVIGRGEGWSCFFYDEMKASCAIYENRFMECRLLKCWDPSDLMAIMGRNTIVRTDIINRGDPVLQLIEAHEDECSFEKIERLLARLSLKGANAGISRKLSDIVKRDLEIRRYATSGLGMKKEFELFIFGRSVHDILKRRGFSVHVGGANF
ncbi:MAG: YkgJ family cysteine cluster protein [Nitrospirota bacterium]